MAKYNLDNTENKIFYPNTTQYPNFVLDEIMSRIDPSEFITLSAIIRKTYGWYKLNDQISMSQLIDITGYQRNTLRKALKGLIEKNLIQLISKGHGESISSYRILIPNWQNSDIEEFKRLYPKRGGSKIDPPTGSKIDPLQGQKLTLQNLVKPSTHTQNSDLSSKTKSIQNLTDEEIKIKLEEIHKNKIFEINGILDNDSFSIDKLFTEIIILCRKNQKNPIEFYNKLVDRFLNDYENQKREHSISAFHLLVFIQSKGLNQPPIKTQPNSHKIKPGAKKEGSIIKTTFEEKKNEFIGFIESHKSVFEELGIYNELISLDYQPINGHVRIVGNLSEKAKKYIESHFKKVEYQTD